MEELVSLYKKNKYISRQQYVEFIVPLLEKIINLHRLNKTIIIGIQGGQGTGKTTIVNFIRDILKKLEYQVESFSIDDFYLIYKEREKLGEKYKDNPFYQIRGMPGTHRVKFLLDTLKKIKQGKEFELPIFDKSLHGAKGDVLKKTINVKQRPDFVLFEGWCLGIPNVSIKELAEISKNNNLNLEKLDPNLKHSKLVLKFANRYQRIWKLLDYITMIKPSSPDFHKAWRYNQEQELKKKTGSGKTKKEIGDFVDFYLPFTYVCYEKIKPDLTLLVKENHKFYRIIWKRQPVFLRLSF